MTQLADPPSSGSSAPEAPVVAAKAMTHREVLEALSGLLLAMFVAMVSSTVVTNALPRIVADLEGTQTGYTWVVVATLLTMTATTPLWGKLADLYDKKILVQSALVIFTIGSLIAAFAPSMEVLIGARAVQGLGVGGLTALVQVVIASMVSPRERGRYSGYIGAVFALATVSGPLIGGVIVDSPLGWRGCFFVPIPIAALALVVLQRRLHLPRITRQVSIDWLGAMLIVGGVSILLVWVSLAGQQYDWVSATSGLLVAVGVLVIAAAIYVEGRVATEPVIPLRLFRDRTTVLATIASAMIGVAMFGSTVYLSQYFQLARGMSPTEAGLMSIAMVGGLLVTSIVTGRVISSTGFWKRYLVGGALLTTVGFALLATIDDTTSLWVVGGFMALIGLGIGATMQNLVLAVQNNTAQADMGAASATVAFFRSMGGAVGVSALGALLNHQVSDKLTEGLARLGIDAAGQGDGSIPDIATLPAPVRDLYQQAFGEATGHLFLVAVPFAAIALLCILAIKEVPLRTTVDRDDEPVATPVSAQDEAVEAVAPAGTTSDEHVRPTHAARYVPEEPDARRAAPVGHHRSATGEDGPR